VLALDDDDGDIVYEDLMSIGKGRAYEKRHEFEGMLHEKATKMQAKQCQWIIAEDPNQEPAAYFSGQIGCNRELVQKLCRFKLDTLVQCITGCLLSLATTYWQWVLQYLGSFRISLLQPTQH